MGLSFFVLPLHLFLFLRSLCWTARCCLATALSRVVVILVESVTAMHLLLVLVVVVVVAVALLAELAVRMMGLAALCGMSVIINATKPSETN